MAKKRMFSNQIVNSDAFLDMPLTSQALYFHLSMQADDDGFVGNPKRITRTVGCGDDDLKILIVKRFILAFKSGIVVIKHWRINNYLQNDRYSETTYQKEKSLIFIKKNKAYTDNKEKCIQNVYKMDAQYSIDKVSIDKGRGSNPHFIHTFKDGTIGREKYGKWVDNTNGAVLEGHYLDELKEAGKL